MGLPRGARPYETIKADADSPFTQYLTQLDQAIIRLDQELCLISGWESDLGKWYRGQDLWQQSENSQVELKYFYHLNQNNVIDQLPDDSSLFHMDDFPFKEIEFDQIELRFLRYDLEETYRSARWEWRPPHLDSEIGPSLVRCRDLFVDFENLVARVGNVAASKDAGEIGEPLWRDYNSNGTELLQLIDDLFSLTKPPSKGKETVTRNRNSKGTKSPGPPLKLWTQIVLEIWNEGKGHKPTVEEVREELIKREVGPGHEDWPESDGGINAAIRRRCKPPKQLRTIQEHIIVRQHSGNYFLPQGPRNIDSEPFFCAHKSETNCAPLRLTDETSRSQRQHSVNQCQVTRQSGKKESLP